VKGNTHAEPEVDTQLGAAFVAGAVVVMEGVVAVHVEETQSP